MSKPATVLIRHLIGFTLLITAVSGLAQTTVDPATGGGSISADNTGTTWTTLTGPVLTETNPGDIALGTIVLTAPSGYEFDTGGTAPYDSVVTAPGWSGATKLVVAYNSMTSTTITFDVTGSSTTPPQRSGQVYMKNVRVRPTSGVIPNSGNITNTGTSAPGGTTNYGTLTVAPGAADAANTTITAADAALANDGIDNTAVTVQAIDAYGNSLTAGGDAVVLSTTLGSLGSVTDNSDGTYTATLTSSITKGTATVTGTMNAAAISDNALVAFKTLPNVWLGNAVLANAKDWELAGNWSLGATPTSGHFVQIPATPANGDSFPEIDTADPTVDSLRIDQGARLDILTGRTLTVRNVLFGGGSLGLTSATLTANGDVQDSLAITGNSATLEFAGAVSAQATFAVSTSTLKYLGSTAQNIQANIDTVANLEINNTAGVTVGTDLTVGSTLTLTAGELIIVSDKNLIANTKSVTSGSLTFQRSIPDSGWYMLSSPVNTTYQDLLDSVMTQGFTNTDYPGATYQPNVLYYDESVQGTHYQKWAKPSDAANTVTGGQGVMVYVFGEVPGDADYTNSLPTTLTANGQEFEGSLGSFNFGVTYSAGVDSGWSLIGNPFGATIDWDAAAKWTKTNIDATIYVWDHTASGGNGDYLVWNGATGSLGNGRIPPFQGFWVKANAASPSLILDNTVKTTGGVFHKPKSPPPVVALEARSGALKGRCYLMLSPDGKPGKDPYDAYRLVPFSNTFLELSYVLENGEHLTINNLPADEPVMTLPVVLDGYRHGQPLSDEVAISLGSLEHVPAYWKLSLRDTRSGRWYDLRQTHEVLFDLSDILPKKGTSYPARQALQKIVRTTTAPDARFRLVIDTRPQAPGIPTEYRLRQNFPNPVRDRTVFEFELPEQARVTLTLYDLLGNKRLTLADRVYSAGIYEVPQDLSGLASGIYLYRLHAGSRVFGKKLVIVK